MNIGKILILGFGSVGQGLLPLLFREFPYLKPGDIQIITADERGVHIAEEYGINHLVEPLTPENYVKFLKIYLEIQGSAATNLIEYVKEVQGNEVTISSNIREELVKEPPMSMNLLINVSVDVSSLDLIAWCKDHHTLYLDTCVEPWKGGYDNPQDIMSTTNFYLREQALELKSPKSPTALIAHGANPGLITYLLKEGLMAIAAHKKLDVLGKSWAAIARDLGVQVIQIAEHDNQSVDYNSYFYKEGTFYNTWSCDGFISELNQRAELSWGSHETQLPDGAILNTVRGFNSVVLPTRSLDTRVQSFSMITGRLPSTLVTHHEALSIGEMLSCDTDGVHYQPTVYYAYRPCILAQKSMEHLRRGGVVEHHHLLGPELIHGSDSLQVLIFLQDGTAFLAGNHLSVDRAQAAAPHNSATTLQVTSSIVAGIHWMLAHPDQGVTEAEQISHREISQVTKPYIGATISSRVDANVHAIASNQFQDFLIEENK